MHRRFGIWTEIVQNKKRLLSVQRCETRRVANTYQTVFIEAIYVFVVSPTEGESFEGHRIIYEIRKENEHVDLAIDDRYEGGSTWWWPYKLIGDANKWIERAHHATMRGCLTYHLIQFFSSHGSFSSYWSSKDNPIQVCVLLVQK